MVLQHFSQIASAVDIPIVVFEYPPASRIGYPPETLARLCEIPHVAAVKDWPNEIVALERNLRALRGSGRPVAMLSSFTMSLMSSSLLGPTGPSRAWAAWRPISRPSSLRGLPEGRSRGRPEDQ